MQSDTHDTDALDIEGSLRGDEAAYARLVQRYEPAIVQLDKKCGGRFHLVSIWYQIGLFRAKEKGLTLT